MPETKENLDSRMATIEVKKFK